MKYEIVRLEEKTVAGVAARTNNMAPDMGMVIGGLWSKFYQEGIYASIEDKVNQKALGIYTDYSTDETGDYTVMVACEAKPAKSTNSEIVYRTIPAGNYAKFVIHGDMVKAVAQFWQELWTMDLPRTFVCDYEEYQNDSMDNAEIHMYIGLK